MNTADGCARVAAGRARCLTETEIPGQEMAASPSSGRNG